MEKIKLTNAFGDKFGFGVKLCEVNNYDLELQIFDDIADDYMPVATISCYEGVHGHRTYHIDGKYNLDATLEYEFFEDCECDSIESELEMVLHFVVCGLNDCVETLESYAETLQEKLDELV